jgi:hypothetical protein
LEARLTLSEALNWVASMLDSYPDKNNPAPYVTALARSLCEHPREVAIASADPVNGVVRTTMFKPTVANIHDWCDQHSEALKSFVAGLDDKLRREAERVRESPREVDRSNRPSLEELRQKFGPNFGLKRMDKIDRALVNRFGEADQEAENVRAEAEAENRAHDAYRRETLAAYARLGAEPVYCMGELVSPELLKSVGVTPARKRDDAEASP